MTIYGCLSRAQRQGWPRSYLSLRLGPDVMGYVRGQIARLLRDNPSTPITRTQLWGCEFDVDLSLDPDQVVVLDPNGEVVDRVNVPL